MKKLLALITWLLLASPVANGFLDFSDSSENTPQVIANLNKNVLPGDSDLWSTMFIIRAPKVITNLSLSSSCEHTEKLIYKNTDLEAYNLYVLKISLYSSDCTNNTVFIKNEWEDVWLYHLNIISRSEELEKTLDSSSENLTAEIKSLTIFLQDTTEKIIQKKDTSTLSAKISQIELWYNKKWIEHQKNIRETILQKRNNLTFISPIQGKILPTRNTKMPNSPRPFRADVTDGIHHGWDVDAPIGTPIRAVGDGIIIRVVNNFVWKDFDTITRKKYLTDYEKAKNLDILRWNQVWLKTMDGNVVFLAHLSEVTPWLQVGQQVNKWDNLGKVWISGVPDKWYTDSHVHFEVVLNPHTTQDIPAPIETMIMWTYLGKWLSKSQVFALQDSLFSGERLARK